MASMDDNNISLSGRFSDIVTEPHTTSTSTSIEECEGMSLVSFEEAIEPLSLIVRDVRRKAWLVKERCQNPSENLSPDQSASIMLYTVEWMPGSDSLYFILNSTLRTGDRTKLKPWFLYLKLLFTALSHLPPMGSRTVYRGIKLDMRHMFPTDKVHVWQGFSSCTTTVSALEQEQFLGKKGIRTLFHIECSTGRCIKQHSYSENENEILLLPGIPLRVISYLNPSRNFHIIQLKEVEPLSSLLESRFDDRSSPVIESTNQPLTKFSSIMSMSFFKAILSRTPENYHNLKIEKIINKCEANSLINLDRQFLRDRDMPSVVQHAVINKQCTVLRLSNNRITAQGVLVLAKELCNNTALEDLSIFGSRMGDQGVFYLSQVLEKDNTTLKVLNLGWNDITDEGMIYIAEMLQKNRTLIKLLLPWNRISDQGLKLLATALIEHNRSLQILSLNLNQLINDSSVNLLIKMIDQSPSLTTLHVHDCSLTKNGKGKLCEVVKLRRNFELNL